MRARAGALARPRWAVALAACSLLVSIPLHALGVEPAGAPGAASAAAGTAAASAPARTKVLRFAFSTAETGFDPAQVSDIYSRAVTAHVFESLLAYDPLARPYKLRPLTAAAMPEVSSDFRTFTFRLRPGIFFADDPAFGGRPRELVAEDYVYSLKRIFDPAWKSPHQSVVADEGILGLQALRDDALRSGLPFDYDRPIEGLRALDRHTLQVRLREPRPRHLFLWAARDTYGAVAREVVEHYGARIMEHPVGTGAFRLAEWRRSSRLVLERNPRFRDERYDAAPEADDAEGRAILARLKGRRLPMVDRVEIDVIEQPQPRWLAFLNGEHDFLDRIPESFVPLAAPRGTLAPHLARRGMTLHTIAASDVFMLVSNMDDATVGGLAAPKVALRRAMALAYDVEREIALVRAGQAIPAQSILPPMTTGYRAEMRSDMSSYSPARARALLELYGYTDRDGDGWREQPDGRPLHLQLATQSDQMYRQLDELWTANMAAIGLRASLKVAQWPENLKAVRNGRFMLWRVGATSQTPDGQSSLERAYGPSSGAGNLARFRLERFDRVYEALKLAPDGPERQALFDEATRLLVAYAPYRLLVHRVLSDLSTAALVGYRRPRFSLDWWQYVDLETPPAP